MPLSQWAALSGAALCFLFAGCAGTEAFGGSRVRVAEWGASRGFAAEAIAAGRFELFALQRGAAPRLTIYIEGDGAPWPNTYHPPRDPTPLRPLALAMAAQDPAPAVAYLGRLCQYLDDEARQACPVDYWTRRRFAPEAVAAMDMAVDRLKARSGASRLRLVGHSGGGTMAALLAARRADVEVWITVAAPLDLAEWIRVHDLTPFEDALDPMSLPGMPRGGTHFAGGRDAVVPPAVVETFVRRHGGRLELIADFDHDCCWARDWPGLLKRADTLEGKP